VSLGSKEQDGKKIHCLGGYGEVDENFKMNF
jgi:hypothetical protein